MVVIDLSQGFAIYLRLDFSEILEFEGVQYTR
jgi:hypothetical protein